MRNFLENIKTPVASQDLLYAFAAAWKQLFNEYPAKNTLCTLLAQVQIECGVGVPFSHCYNFGNIKSTDKDSYDYTFYKCNEIVPKKMGLQMVANANKDGGKAYITSEKSNGDVVIWFEPNNKYCRFRAYSTKEEGALAHLIFLKNRYVKFPEVWLSIVNGDPAKFSHLLRQYKYYTADEAVYTKGVLRIYNQMQKLEYNTDKIPQCCNFENNNEEEIAERQQIMNTVAMSLDDFARSQAFIDPVSTDDEN